MQSEAVQQPMRTRRVVVQQDAQPRGYRQVFVNMPIIESTTSPDEQSDLSLGVFDHFRV
jgi:hypothetical protein